MVLTHDTIDDSLTKMQEKKSKFQGKEEDQRRLELEINNVWPPGCAPLPPPPCPANACATTTPLSTGACPDTTIFFSTE